MGTMPERVHYFQANEAPREEREEIKGYLDRLEQHTHVSHHFTNTISEVVYQEEVPGKEEKKPFSFQGRSGIISGLKALLGRVEPPQQQ